VVRRFALTGDWADTIINTRDKNGFPSCKAKCLVHNDLVVANYVCVFQLACLGCLEVNERTDSTELGKCLNCYTMHQSRSPLRDCEHDSPARDSNGFFCCQSLLDFIEFRLEPIAVVAIVVKLAQHFHGLVFSIDRHQVTRTLREEDHTDSKDLLC
jgi:hypothetical protein